MSANIVFGITLKPDGFGNFTGQVTGASDAVKKFGTQGAESGRQIESGMDRAQKGVQALAAEVLRGVAALAAYRAVVANSVTAANQYESALLGLASVARFAGEDIDATLNKAAALTADGLLSVSEAALSLKNLLARGFTTEQAVQMIARFKDSAAFGRQASLEFGQAVVSATEGIKNENSILVDNAGVTQNVSKMWEAYAAQIGVGVQKLTQAQKREAEYAGVLRETEGQLGNAALASDSLMGAQARMRKATNDAAIAFGQALTPAATTMANALAWTADNVLKPFILLFQNMGTSIGHAAMKFSLLAGFISDPSKWSGAGIRQFKAELKTLSDLAEQQSIDAAKNLLGDVQPPNIGKDSGARRKDVVLPTVTVTPEAKKRATEYAALIKTLEGNLTEAAAKHAGFNAEQTELAKLQSSSLWAKLTRDQRTYITALLDGTGALKEQQRAEADAAETAQKHETDYANIIKTLEGNLTTAAAKHAGLNAEQTELAKMQASPIWEKLTEDQRGYIAALLDGTSALNEQMRAEEAEKKALEAASRAREDAVEFIDRMNQSSRQTLADLEFRAGLEGKSALETARLTAERKAQLDIDKQILEINRQYKNDLPARDAALAEIQRARPGIINNAAAAANAQAIADAHEQEAKRAEQAWERFSENVQRNLGDELFKGLSGKFMDIGDMFKQMLLRMAADAAAAQIMIMGKNLFAAFAGAGGTGTVGASPSISGGGFAPGSVATAKGAWFTGETAHYYANGGAFSNQTFDRPTPFAFANGGGFNLGVMGEAGPEAVMPLTRDASGKLGVQAQGGGRSVHITYAPVIQIDSRSDRAQIERLVGAQIKQGNADLVDRLQREGAL